MSAPLLELAEELERRDGRAVSELAEVERLGREVERARAEAEDVAVFLETLPAAYAAVAAETGAAETAHAQAAAAADEAEAELRRAGEHGREHERLAAARAAQHARDDLREAELRVVRALTERARIEAEEARRLEQAAALEVEARALAERLGTLPRVAREASAPPRAGLEGVLGWASQARGGLLVAAAGIASERDRVAREASELLAAVSGDALAVSAAAGLRERVARVLGGG